MAGVPVAGRFGVAWVVEEAGQPLVYRVGFLDSSVCVLGPSRPEPVVGVARLRDKTGGLGRTRDTQTPWFGASGYRVGNYCSPSDGPNRGVWMRCGHCYGIAGYGKWSRPCRPCSPPWGRGDRPSVLARWWWCMVGGSLGVGRFAAVEEPDVVGYELDRLAR